jgi:hypothetical protein
MTLGASDRDVMEREQVIGIETVVQERAKATKNRYL